jgi:cytochrome P450
MTLSHRRLPADEPPGPTEALDLGDAGDSIERMLQWFAAHGDTYRVFSPGRSSWTWVVHHPDDVKRVLVTNHRNYTKGVGIDRVRLLLGNGIMTSEGEFWRGQRRMMQPAFHRRLIERFAAVVRRLNGVMLDRWARCAERGEAVNLTRSVSELALEVVLDSIFSEDLDRLVTDMSDNPLMIVARDTSRDPHFAYQFRGLGRVVQQIIRQRRAQRVRHDDLAQMLMESTDPDTGQGMSERELLDEILTLVVAGHETTASALTWTWWLLAQHPEVERRLHEEQDRVGDLGAAPTYGDLDRLPYTFAMLRETLRLYPPGWLLTRRAIGPDRLGGFDVPPGTDVFLSPFVIHRHPAFWDNAECFDPSRFEAGRSAARHKFACLPFGAGPRHCIGENFSIFEMMLHLNCAARRFRLRPADTEPVTMEARINLRTTRDIQMMVEKR